MKHIWLAAAALLAAAAVTPALADDVNVASTDGTAAVRVFKPLTITQTLGLDFGAITSGAAGTVEMSVATGERKATGGVGLVAQFPGSLGAFHITGEDNAMINVVADSAITGFQNGIAGATLPGVLPTQLGAGSIDFVVGGVLSIPANTPAGAYMGVYSVAVNYP